MGAKSSGSTPAPFEEERMHPRPNMPVVTPITWGARGTYLTFATFRFVENIYISARILSLPILRPFTTKITAFTSGATVVGCDGRWVSARYPVLLALGDATTTCRSE